MWLKDDQKITCAQNYEHLFTVQFFYNGIQKCNGRSLLEYQNDYKKLKEKLKDKLKHRSCRSCGEVFRNYHFLNKHAMEHHPENIDLIKSHKINHIEIEEKNLEENLENSEECQNTEADPLSIENSNFDDLTSQNLFNEKKKRLHEIDSEKPKEKSIKIDYEMEVQNLIPNSEISLEPESVDMEVLNYISNSEISLESECDDVEIQNSISNSEISTKTNGDDVEVLNFIPNSEISSKPECDDVEVIDFIPNSEISKKNDGDDVEVISVIPNSEILLKHECEKCGKAFKFFKCLKKHICTQMKYCKYCKKFLPIKDLKTHSL